MSKKNFEFAIPAYLLFSSTDFFFNRADVYFLAASIKLIKTAIYIIGAYDFPIDDLSSLFDSDGNWALSNQETVNLLNSFFTLSDLSYMTKAKVEFKEAILNFRNGLKLINENSITNGTFRTSEENKIAFTKLYEISEDIYTSITDGNTAISHIEPAMNLDLKLLFESPPSAVDIGSSPFKLDANGEVKAN